MEHDSGSSHLGGKIAAGFSVALLVVAGFFAYKVARNFTAPFPVEFLEISEAFQPGADCSWVVEVTIRNDSDDQIEVRQMRTIMDRRALPAKPIDYPTLDPGEIGTVTGFWDLSRLESCPKLEDVLHGEVTLRLRNGSAVSKGF